MFSGVWKHEKCEFYRFFTWFRDFSQGQKEASLKTVSIKRVFGNRQFGAFFKIKEVAGGVVDFCRILR